MKKPFIIIFSFLLSSCIVCNFKVAPNGGVRPKYPNFSLAEKATPLNSTGLIDTNAIYVEKFNRDYSFIRFFSDGRVFESHNLNYFPTNEDINNLGYGRAGYYKIVENELVIETFTFVAPAWILFFPRASYFKLYHKIRKDGSLELYAVDKYTFFGFIPYKSELDEEYKTIYKKYKSDNFIFEAKPDW